MTANIASNWSSTNGVHGTNPDQKWPLHICWANNPQCVMPFLPDSPSTRLIDTPIRWRWRTSPSSSIVYTPYFLRTKISLSSRRRSTSSKCLCRTWEARLCALFSAPEVQYTRVDKAAEFWGLSGSASINGKQVTLTVTNPHLTESREAEIAVRGARACGPGTRVDDA